MRRISCPISEGEGDFRGNRGDFAEMREEGRK